MPARSQRGSALVMSVLVVLVIAIIGVAVIRFASREVAGATASRKTQALVACADAGRQVIVSQFKALGISPVSLTALNMPMDANTSVVGGHYDRAGVQVTQVVVPARERRSVPTAARSRTSRNRVHRSPAAAASR